MLLQLHTFTFSELVDAYARLCTIYKLMKQKDPGLEYTLGHRITDKHIAEIIINKEMVWKAMLAQTGREQHSALWICSHWLGIKYLHTSQLNTVTLISHFKKLNP